MVSELKVNNSFKILYDLDASSTISVLVGPVRIIYELIPLGATLHEVINTMGKWGLFYREQLHRNGSH
ncbi:MAG: winged helix-turn-helix transcriptional regulator [Niastella sp.]|jgi:DNA-binding HxlR family transcriptional regulator|uniref:winged helix-turn-helix transcriptional regulator n=1 Tax=Niastella sp. TaxID=1869183 RepID=UPI00389AF325